MNKLYTRLFVSAIIIGSGLFYYYVSYNNNCAGPKVETWLSTTTARVDETVSDERSSDALIQDLFIPTPTPVLLPNSLPLMNPFKDPLPDLRAKLRKLSEKAHTRYSDQQSQETPECLSELQGKVVKVFYYDWKYYEAAANEDKELTSQQSNSFKSALDDVIIELDRLSAKYNQ